MDETVLMWRERAYRAEKALERLTGVNINEVVERLRVGGDPVFEPATINLALTEADKDRMVPLAHASGRTLSCWALETLRAAAPREVEEVREALRQIQGLASNRITALSTLHAIGVIAADALSSSSGEAPDRGDGEAKP